MQGLSTTFDWWWDERQRTCKLCHRDFESDDKIEFVVADPLTPSLQYTREDPHEVSEAAYHEIGVKTTINQALTTLVAKGEVASVSAYCARSMSWPCQIASS